MEGVRWWMRRAAAGRCRGDRPREGRFLEALGYGLGRAELLQVLLDDLHADCLVHLARGEVCGFVGGVLDDADF